MLLSQKHKEGKTMINETSNTYKPEPIDTSDVTLPSSLTPLVEALAENVHDIWAKGRLEAGWTYGSLRDDTQKQHPCLIPYEQLPESEKEYDRNTAISTLKLICKMGYVITASVDLGKNDNCKKNCR